jgi:hypothetical protein
MQCSLGLAYMGTGLPEASDVAQDTDQHLYVCYNSWPHLDDEGEVGCHQARTWPWAWWGSRGRGRPPAGTGSARRPAAPCLPTPKQTGLANKYSWSNLFHPVRIRHIVEHDLICYLSVPALKTVLSSGCILAIKLFIMYFSYQIYPPHSMEYRHGLKMLQYCILTLLVSYRCCCSSFMCIIVYAVQ